MRRPGIIKSPMRSRATRSLGSPPHHHSHNQFDPNEFPLGYPLPEYPENPSMDFVLDVIKYRTGQR